MNSRKKIAFIYLDEKHHLYHFISVAIALSKVNDVHILTYKGDHQFLHNTLNRLDGVNVIVEELPTLYFRALTDRLKNRKLPRKGFWLKKNKDYLINYFDAIIVTDYIHKYLLKARKNAISPKIIKFPHGTPGRAYWHNEKLKDFDAQLVLGEFQHNQLDHLNLLGPNPFKAGYVKMDAVPLMKEKDLFKNERPTVIYNPHFDPEFSSWNKVGMEVLEYFYNQETYNLIFAPHLHLFDPQKSGEKAENIPQKYLDSDKIIIDFGGEKSVNMLYINSADIYLGDVSSQVYEFIIKPRPAIFLNTRNINYKNDIHYRFWKTGEVINNISGLNKALSNTSRLFEKYKPVQKKITAENYYQYEGKTASETAAEQINNFLSR